MNDPIAITSDQPGADTFTAAGRRALVLGTEALGVAEVWLHSALAVRELRTGGAHAIGFRATRTGIERTLLIGDTVVHERIIAAPEAAAVVIEWQAAGDIASLDVAWRAPAHAGA